MFLHIGENVTILGQDIIAIIDKKTIESSVNTKKFIDKMIKDGCLCNNIDNVKSYVLTSSKKTIKEYGLYMSNISSSTLSKRSKIQELDWRSSNK